jgi:hypothetical protein
MHSHVQHLQHHLVWVTNAMGSVGLPASCKNITPFPMNAGMVNARTTQTENKQTAASFC